VISFSMMVMASLHPPPASVVILPTLWSGPWVWAEQRARLAACAPTLLELSDAVVNWSVEPTLEAVDAYVLEQLKAAPAPWLLVGCSLGGLLALRAALNRPESTAAVVVSGCPGLGVGEDFDGRPRLHLTFEEACAVRQSLFPDSSRVSDDLLRASVEAVASRDAARRGVRLVRRLGQYDAGADLARLNTPTSMIWGAADRLSPPEPWRAAAAINPALHFVDVAGTGHVPMLEAPEAFNVVLDQELAWLGLG
jgi:pimeloyl-ACP methyl ester carboxylesterase